MLPATAEAAAEAAAARGGEGAGRLVHHAGLLIPAGGGALSGSPEGREALRQVRQAHAAAGSCAASGIGR
jgi:hypothetical protein